MTTPSHSFGSRFALAALTLALMPIRSHAAPGLNLAWNHCLGSGLGVQNVAFACDTNAGTHVMTGSFVLGSDFAQVIGDEIVLQLASASAVLPAWWQFVNGGSCRQTSLVGEFALDPADAPCVDWSAGQQVGGLAGYLVGPNVEVSAANAARVKLITAVVQQAAQDLVGGIEYFAFRLVMDHVHTVGAESCAGCNVPVCLVLNSIVLEDKGGFHRRSLTTSVAPGSNYITWQGGGVPVVGGVSGCPAAVPTRPSTWGSVKSMYR